MKKNFLITAIEVYILRFSFLFSVIFIGIICYLTLWYIPDEEVATFSFKYLDKLIHFIMFGSLSFVLSFDLQCKYPKLNLFSWLLWVIPFLSSTIIGGVIEILQESYCELRTGDIYDWLADLLGAFCFSVIYMKFCYNLVVKFLKTKSTDN